MKKPLILLGLMLALLVSCEQDPSLQKYYVEKSGNKDFVTLDIAPSFINTDSIKLSEDEKTALKSLEKFNVLVYRANAAKQAEFETERDKVKTLLKQDSYEELIKFNNGTSGATISTKGEGENIDEFVVFVHNSQNGFGVVRVLGDDMTPNNVLTIAGLLQKANLNMEQFKPLQQLMTNNAGK